MSQNKTKFHLSFFYTINGGYMKVKVFDEGHEKDLENSVNEFLKGDIEVLDIKFSCAVSVFSEEQIYCFSCLILYR